MRKSLLIWIILIMSICILSGCGVLFLALAQAFIGTQVGLVCIPAIVAATGLNGSDANTPLSSGMILILEDSPVPKGYVPAVNAKVSLEGTGYVTYTDSTGKFQLDKIPAGKYTIRVEYPGYTSIQQPIEITTDNTQQAASGYYKILPEGTTLLTIRKGLIPVPQADFSFDVYGLDPNGVPIKHGGIWSVDSDNATIDNNGSFRTTVAGTYKVTNTSGSNASGGKMSSSADTSSSVSVIVTESAITIRGYIRDNTGQPLSIGKMSPKETNLYSISDSNGYFEITGVPSIDPITLEIETETKQIYDLVINAGTQKEIVLDIKLPDIPATGLTPVILPTLTPTPFGGSSPTPTPAPSLTPGLPFVTPTVDINIVIDKTRR